MPLIVPVQSRVLTACRPSPDCMQLCCHPNSPKLPCEMVGHCAQYNTLNEKLPQYDDLPKRLLRSAVIGFSASAISDTCSNSIRVIKTTKQTHTEAVTYPQVLKVPCLPDLAAHTVLSATMTA